MEYKYKYLHICPPSTRMLKNYATMLQKYFNIEDHHFLCRVQSNGGDGFTVLTKNVKNFNDLGKGKLRKFFALRRELSQAQTIVIHGFMFPLPWLLFLFFHKKFLNRAVWVIWGVDLYNYHREKGNRLISRVINYMEDEVRRAVKTPVIVFPTDYPVYRKIFGDDGKPVMCAPLGTPDAVFDEWDELIKKRQEVYDKYFGGDRNSPGREKSIQVGHNAFPFNKHGEILTQLERFKNEKMKITLPLSYGNDYGDTNSNYIANIEGLIKNLSMTNVCRILKTLMPKSKYFEFLAAVDVAILNADRQNALGNILPLLYMGKKIYLSERNPLYKFFRDEGFEIHNTGDIYNISYEEFIEPTKTPYPDPWIRTFYSIEFCAKKWDIVFGYNEGRYSKDEALSLMGEIESEQRAVVNEKRAAYEHMALLEWLKRRYEEDQRLAAKKAEEEADKKEKWEQLRKEKVRELLRQKKKNQHKVILKEKIKSKGAQEKNILRPYVEIYLDKLDEKCLQKRSPSEEDFAFEDDCLLNDNSRYIVAYRRPANLPERRVSEVFPPVNIEEIDHITEEKADRSEV